MRIVSPSLFLFSASILGHWGCSEAGSDSGSEPLPSGGASNETEASDSNRTGGTTSSPGDSPTAQPATCFDSSDGTTTLILENHCSTNLTVRAHVRDEDIAAESLEVGKSLCWDLGGATENFGGRAWGWVTETGDPGGERHTLAEFTFNDVNFYDMDWYNISHVDASNLPMAFLPIDGPDCPQPSCPMNFLENCPDVGKYTNAGGVLISCISPDRDNPESEVARYFEKCDDSYAWSGDDQSGDDVSPMKACKDGPEDYRVVFCP